VQQMGDRKTAKKANILWDKGLGVPGLGAAAWNEELPLLAFATEGGLRTTDGRRKTAKKDISWTPGMCAGPGLCVCME